MIQRIQSVWLFVAAFLSGALFILPLYHYTPAGAAVEQLMGARNEYLLLILAALMAVLPLVAIFMFKNRGRQKGLTWLSILASAGFIAAMLMKIQNIKNTIPAPTNDNFALPGPIVPVLAIVCLFMALSGIRKDDKLVKSADRLR